MSHIDPKDLEKIDQEIRINELKAQIEETCGQPLASYENENCPPDIREQFYQHVLDDERAPRSSPFVKLQTAGVELPHPDALDDKVVTAKLWEVIEALAQKRIFLRCTDHYSDRELYSHLWHESLREAMGIVVMDGYSACTIDLVSDGREKSIQLWMRYYADDETRERWASDWPADNMPPKEKPPFDRDRYLPQLKYEIREWEPEEEEEEP